VLGAGVAETITVDVAQIPFLAGLDALMAASAVDESRSHLGSECSALGAMFRAVFAAIGSSPLAAPRSWPVRHLLGREIHSGGGRCCLH